MIEATLIMPLLLLLSLGTAEFGLYLYQWNATSKATQIGARWAVVNPPISAQLDADLKSTGWWLPDTLGKSCRQIACQPAPGVGYDCHSGVPGCNMTPILAQMRRVFPSLRDEDVQVTYEPFPQAGALGFVGRPGGVPVSVTVGIRCREFEFGFLSSWFPGGWVTTADTETGCSDQNGLRIPASATQLSSESFGATTF
ncbi:hypothetical protein AA309_13155 [Microvirga vignae]|uniref:TadE-like domain-containing protein n=2 Tax=Microvirga vignae TaxID=1225564 RepID=A0A0H1RBQ1_9HYPH|nr:hypothetical protein AA309_13155 [Microvirga vignae]